jgi:hypothetical protein
MAISRESEGEFWSAMDEKGPPAKACPIRRPPKQKGIIEKTKENIIAFFVFIYTIISQL